MTLITCNIYQSGSSTPVDGYINVTARAYLTDSTRFYTTTPVKYSLVAGTTIIDLIPTDIAKTAYRFDIYANSPTPLASPDTLLNSFDAVVPFSATAINLNVLAPQAGLRYDTRDASLLTLARFLVSNDNFINFLGNRLWANKGTWDVAVIYRRGDVVLRNGSSYQFVSEIQSANIPPETRPDLWFLLAQAGSGGGGSSLMGSMTLFPTVATVPLGYLRCNGAAVSRTTYATLFSTIGIAYGAGNGTTTFNIPDSPVNGTSSFIVYTSV